MKKKNNIPIPKNGYTLIELLIVSSILAVVMMAIYSSFISGMILWERSKNISQIDTKVILGLEKFSSSLRQSINFSPIGFNGTINKLSFPARDNRQIVRITFEFDENSKILKTVKEKYPDFNLPSDKFIGLLENAEFSYFYYDGNTEKYFWKEECSPTEGRPRAVKLSVKTKGGVKNATVFIPVY